MPRRYRVLLNGFAVSLPYDAAAEAPPPRASRDSLPEPSYTLSMNRGPPVIGAPRSRAPRSGRRRREGGRRRRRRRPRAPVPRPGRLLVPGRLPEGPAGFDDAEGDRRARSSPAPGAEQRRRSIESQSFHGTFVAGVIGGVETTAPAGVSGTCASAGGCHPAVNGPRAASRPASTSATTACSACRPRSAAAARPTRRRSSPRSRRPSPTGWTSSTSRAAARRAIRAPTSSCRRSRTS